MNESELQWQCNVCKKWRPDKYISTNQVNLQHTRTCYIQSTNVKFCNDSKICTEKAKYFNMLGDGFVVVNQC